MFNWTCCDYHCHFDQSTRRVRRGEISELPLSRLLRRFLDKLEMTMAATDKGESYWAEGVSPKSNVSCLIWNQTRSFDCARYTRSTQDDKDTTQHSAPKAQNNIIGSTFLKGELPNGALAKCDWRVFSFFTNPIGASAPLPLNKGEAKV